MARSSPRIVHLITRLDLGGAQQNTLYCAEHHDRSRFRVGLWAGGGGRLDAAARAIRDADVRILPWLVHPISPPRDAAAAIRLAGMLGDVDLVHTHSSKAGILGRLAAASARVPAVVHTVHGWSFNDFQPAPLRRFYVEAERAAARMTDRIVCVARADVDKGLALGIGRPDQYRLVRSGIDPDVYVAPAGARARFRESIGAGQDDIVVGSIANLKHQKGPLDFIAAAGSAYERNARLRFVFAGDGELRRDVERAIEEHGLRGIVHLLGWRDDVAEILAGFDLFLLTSLFEGLPRSVLQAMAASVPVVATRTGGVSEVIDDGRTGLLVPPAEPEAAARAVLVLAGDRELRERLAVSAKRALAAEFDIRLMVRDLEAIYGELLRESPPKSRHATGASHLGAEYSRN